MNSWKTSLFALALATLIAAAAHAEENAPYGAGAPQTQNADSGTENGFLDETKMDELKNMSPEDRQKFFSARAKNFENMSPEQIDQYKQKRREWFNSLPQDRQEKMRERFKDMGRERMREKKKWFDGLSEDEKQKFISERRARMGERMKNMSPEDRQKFQQRLEGMKNFRENGNRQEHRSGGDQFDDRNGGGEKGDKKNGGGREFDRHGDENRQ